MKRSKHRILLIEDDANLAMILSKFLLSNGYYVEYVYEGHKGLKMALSNKYQLIIVDIGLPDITGLQIVSEIRKVNNKPIIVITGDNTNNTELATFQFKANIFHSKPIKFEILLAQISTLLKEADTHRIIKSQNIYIDISKNIFRKENKKVYFTKTEFDFLLMLFNSNGEIFSREKIIATLMNYYREQNESCVDTMISRIRKKLEEKPTDSIIKTINKSGYSINPKYLNNITTKSS
jgi:DNA-binding response OmpR family regulator